MTVMRCVSNFLPHYPHRKYLQAFIIGLACLIAYKVFFGRVIEESIKRRLTSTLLFFSNKAEMKKLISYLEQQDAHFVAICTSNGLYALEAARNGRNAVIFPRHGIYGKLIWKTVLANDLTQLVRVEALPSTSKAKHDSTWRRLVSKVNFEKVVLSIDLCEATNERRYEVAVQPFLKALKVKAIMTHWPLRTARDVSFFFKFGFRPFAALDSLQSLSLSEPHLMPDHVVWKKENESTTGAQPNVFLLSAKERNLNLSASVLNLPLDIQSGISGAKTEVKIFLYKPPDLVSDFVRQGGWENHIIYAMLRFIKRYPDIQFLDFGTFVGVYTLHAANIGRKVVGVDANRNNLVRLANSVATNGFEDRVTLVHNALDKSYGDRFVQLLQKNLGASKVKTTGSKALPVQAIKADDLLPLIPFKRAVLKVDIEGFEGKMLAGASKLFSSIDIVMVMMEWIIKFLPVADRHFILQFMRSRGYEAYSTIESDTILTGDNANWPIDIVWKRPLQKKRNKTHRGGLVRIFDKNPVSAPFTRHTLRTPTGQVAIFTYGSEDLISRSIMQDGTWEASLNSAIATVLREDKQLQLIDFGANVGVYTLIGAEMGRKVVAVDANINNVMRLRKSVLTNGFEHLVKIVWNAIDSGYKTLRMIIPDSNIGGSWVVNHSDPRATKGTDVSTVTMDDIAQIIDFKKAIMKFDIEGMEFAGLHNASRLFSQIDIPYVFMEWGVIQRDYKKKGGRAVPDFIINFFQTRGYQACREIHDDGKLDSNFDAWPWDIVWHKARL